MGLFYSPFEPIIVDGYVSGGYDIAPIFHQELCPEPRDVHVDDLSP